MFWKNKNTQKPAPFNKLVEPPIEYNDNYKQNVVANTSFPGQEYLMYDATNEFVALLQKKLMQIGYDIPGGANGFYGVATANAIKKYYEDNDLGNNSGKHMGPRAWYRLFGR